MLYSNTQSQQCKNLDILELQANRQHTDHRFGIKRRQGYHIKISTKTFGCICYLNILMDKFTSIQIIGLASKHTEGQDIKKIPTKTSGCLCYLNILLGMFAKIQIIVLESKSRKGYHMVWRSIILVISPTQSVKQKGPQVWNGQFLEFSESWLHQHFRMGKISYPQIGNNFYYSPFYRTQQPTTYRSCTSLSDWKHINQITIYASQYRVGKLDFIPLGTCLH